MAMTRNPSAAKRRIIAEPVPGPTPVTTAIGLSDIGASPSVGLQQQDSRQHQLIKRSVLISTFYMIDII
jgi:hypothetical protein